MSDQRNDFRNDSSHERTIMPMFTLDEYEDVKRRAYAAGLDAARDAVDRIVDCPECSVDAALAAIDELRGGRV